MLLHAGLQQDIVDSDAGDAMPVLVLAPREQPMGLAQRALLRHQRHHRSDPGTRSPAPVPSSPAKKGTTRGPEGECSTHVIPPHRKVHDPSPYSLYDDETIHPTDHTLLLKLQK